MIKVNTEPTSKPTDNVHEQSVHPKNSQSLATGLKESKANNLVSASNKQENISLDSLTDLESILNYLSTSQASDQPYLDSSYKVRGLIRQLVKDTPELGFELLEAYLAAEDQNVKHQLSLALSTIDTANEHTLEPWLVSRIENGDRPGEWLALLGEWGLKSRSGFDSVLAQLNNNPDPSVISNSIKALDRTLSSYPLAMSPNQRVELSSQLKQHLASSDSDIRSAAVGSLASFPQNDMAQLLLNAFNDPSSKVRHAALMSYMRRPTPSADIQNLVLHQLQDSSRSLKERSSLASLASTLKLSEYERTLAESIQQEMEREFMNLTEEEQRAQSQELDDY